TSPDVYHRVIPATAGTPAVSMTKAPAFAGMPPWWGKSSAQPEDFAVGRAVGAGSGEIVECLLGDADDVARNELRPFPGAVFGVLERAFPFEHRPTLEVIGGELGEDGREIHLPVADGAEAPCPVHPALVTAIDALPAGR